MPFNAKYCATEIQRVLKNKMNTIPHDDGRLSFNHGGVTSYFGFENDHALVLFPAADVEDDKQLRSITDGLMNISTHVQAAAAENKKIIIPVAELQKTFGLFQRKHFVTLCYDPIKNVATLIDSRPWIVSFLYPTSSMENMLRSGLSTILGDNKIKTMRFQKMFQRVQHNDTHCGAWTTANIMGLAGIDLRSPNDVTTQASTFTSDDEVNVVNNNIMIANSDAPKLMQPTGWFQKLVIRLGFTKYSSVQPDSYKTMSQYLPNDNRGKHHDKVEEHESSSDSYSTYTDSDSGFEVVSNTSIDLDCTDTDSDFEVVSNTSIDLDYTDSDSGFEVINETSIDAESSKILGPSC